MSADKRTDQPAEGAPENEPGFQPSRRSVLHGAAGLAGAGLAGAVMAGTLAAPAPASAASRAPPGRARWTYSPARARSGCVTATWPPGSPRPSADPDRPLIRA